MINICNHMINFEEITWVNIHYSMNLVTYLFNYLTANFQNLRIGQPNTPVTSTYLSVACLSLEIDHTQNMLSHI